MKRSIRTARHVLYVLGKYKKVMLNFLALIIMFFLFDVILKGLEQQHAHGVYFRYEHTPKNTAGEGVSMPEKVIFSSTANNWDITNNSYRMYFDGKNSWTNRFKLDPGLHQFRYALYYPPQTLHGTNTIGYEHDPYAPSGMRYNDKKPRSEYFVRDIAALRKLIDFVFLAFLIGILLFLPIRFWMARFMRSRMSLQFKIIFTFLFLLCVSNVGFLWLSTSQHAEFARTIQRDIFNTIHTMLISEDIQFQDIQYNSNMQFAITERLERFFQSARLFQNYNNSANNSLRITRVSVLDREGNILVNVMEKNLLLLIQTYFTNEQKLTGYFTELTQNVFQHYTSLKKSDQDFFSFQIFDYFTDNIRRQTFEDVTRQYQERTVRFKENGYIIPIQHDSLLARFLSGNQILGYYFFEVDGISYSSFFEANLSLNVALLTIFLIFSFFLMMHITSIMLEPILCLIEGLGKVREENFDFNIEVHTQDEIEALGEAYNFMRARIKKSEGDLDYYIKHVDNELEIRTHDLAQANAIHEENLFLARRVQERVLETGKQIANNTLDYDVVYSPCSEVGGDFYNISRVRQSCIRIFLADVTGHGLPAALVTMLLMSEYEKVKGYDPVTLLQMLNEVFVSTYSSLTVFFTGIVLDINLANMTLHYVCAGHPSQYIVRNAHCISLFGKGRILGVVENPNLELQELALKEDDCIVLFTDGLLEQTNPGDEEYGNARIKEVLRREAGRRTCAELNAEICGDLARFQAAQSAVDDITLITIRCRNGQQKEKKNHDEP